MFKEMLRTDNRGSTKSKVLGVGINDAPYQTAIKISGKIYTCPYFIRWVAMLTRCYSQRWLKKHPTYIGCYVVVEWHSFMMFKKWMQTQDWKNKHLDKDLLSFDSGVYSPDTCLFITPQINSLFGTGSSKTTELPIGIHHRNNKYEVGVSMGNSKRVWIGSYNTIPEAIDAYIKAKTIATKKVMKQTNDLKTRKAIIAYLKYFTDKLILLKTGY